MRRPTRRAHVYRDRHRVTRPWRVDLVDGQGRVNRTRWFSFHEGALRWAARKVHA